MQRCSQNSQTLPTPIQIAVSIVRPHKNIRIRSTISSAIISNVGNIYVHNINWVSFVSQIVFPRSGRESALIAFNMDA